MNATQTTVAVSIFAITRTGITIAHAKRDTFVPTWILNIVTILMNVLSAWQIAIIVSMYLEGKLFQPHMM